MSKAVRTPSQQARVDNDKSKLNPVKSFKDMSPEERAAKVAEVNGVDREVAQRRAEQAAKGIRR